MHDNGALYLNHTHTGAPSKQSNRVVLVTGAAGFIGFHVAKHLVEDWSVREVVGLDLFNDYYDKQLKKDRASKLLDIGVKVSAMLCQ